MFSLNQKFIRTEVKPFKNTGGNIGKTVTENNYIFVKNILNSDVDSQSYAFGVMFESSQTKFIPSCIWNCLLLPSTLPLDCLFSLLP